MLIEHLLNFFEIGFRIYYKEASEYEFLKMALNTAFSEEMEDLGKDKIVVVVIKKMTLILTLLQMIYMRRHEGQVAGLLMDTDEVDYLAKLIRISLVDKTAHEFNTTVEIQDINKPYNVVSLYKKKLMSLL